MKLFCLFLIALAVLALTEARPRRKYKFTKGNSGTSGWAGGDDTSVDTESKVNAGDSGNLAMSKGHGWAKGAEESSVDLKSWAGFEDWMEGGAGGGGKAIGDKTAVDTDSEVYVDENGAQAHANSKGGAKGTGLSAIDIDAFGGLDKWSSGSASGGGKAEGDLSEVDSESSVKSELGWGTLAKSSGKGAARSDGRLASVKLEHMAEIDETGILGKSSATAIGNKALDCPTAIGNKPLHLDPGRSMVQMEPLKLGQRVKQVLRHLVVEGRGVVLKPVMVWALV